MERFNVVSEVVSEAMNKVNGLQIGEAWSGGCWLFEGTEDDMELSVTVVREEQNYTLALVKNINYDQAEKFGLEMRYDLAKTVDTAEDVKNLLMFTLL